MGACVGEAPSGPSEPGRTPDPPTFTALTPSADRLDLEVGESITFEVRAESPSGLPVTVTFSVDGIPRHDGSRFQFEPAEPGEYHVEAVASDGEREKRHEWTLEVASPAPPPNAAPSASLSLDPGSGTAPLEVRVRLGGEDPDGTVVSYRIEVSGSTSLSIERAAPLDTILTLDEGSYQIRGIVEDDAGATGVSTRSITVDPAPNRPPTTQLTVDPTSGMAPLDVLVDARGTDPDGNIVRYELDLDGDGEFELGARTPLVQTARYTEPGKVWVRMRITDNRGAMARDSTLVRISAAGPANQAPSVSLDVSPESGEAPHSVHATATGDDPDGAVTSVSIDFDGDGGADATTTTTTTLDVDHTFASAGTYEVRATVTDDDGATTTVTATVTVDEPADDGGTGGDDGGTGGDDGGTGGDDGGTEPNVPPSGSLTADRTAGDADLAVALSGSGSDPDGSIVTWEIDDDTGDGFVEVPEGKTTVAYPYRDSPYQPRLRLTDDAGASTVVDGPAITVYRPVDAGNSKTSADGNPRFDQYSIAPAMWADGKDAVVFTVVVRDHEGNPLSGVPLRVRSTRQDLQAPDGTKLRDLVQIEMDADRTDGSGRLTGRVTSLTSTRVEGIPEPGKFVPFGLEIDADVGHGEWRPLPGVTGLNAETLVDGDEGEGSFYVSPPASSGICVGDTVQLHVRAIRRDDAPLAGKAAGGRYVEIRYLVGKELLGVEPLQGYESWRTDADGWIHFEYHVTQPNSKALQAWADGFPLNITAVIGASTCD